MATRVPEVLCLERWLMGTTWRRLCHSLDPIGGGRRQGCFTYLLDSENIPYAIPADFASPICWLVEKLQPKIRSKLGHWTVCFRWSILAAAPRHWGSLWHMPSTTRRPHHPRANLLAIKLHVLLRPCPSLPASPCLFLWDIAKKAWSLVQSEKSWVKLISSAYLT